MNLIQNPILKGFNPDPSILRVGEDYFIATSTFQWWPGVQIHHSRDLRHWRLLTRPLDRPSQLNMLGNPDSAGIWAPALSFADGQFHLVYTDVKGLRWMDLETHNYLVTAPAIDGPWSDPIYLNSSGIDPSLFHAPDGRKWLLNMVFDDRKDRDPFAGIWITEYDPAQGRLVGEGRCIFRGTEASVTEGPHLYHREGYYYLVTAEGGTAYDHQVTVARSRELFGPYELHPRNPLLTARHDRGLTLQKAGHASFVELPDGQWYLAHLCARPLPDSDRCILGRETALQPLEWDDEGWPQLANGGNEPQLEVPAPAVPAQPLEPTDAPARDDFDTPDLPLAFQTLRAPLGEAWLSLRERPGYLRLRGGAGLSSLFRQSLVARRLQAFRASATTALEFAPSSFLQRAGLVAYYDTRSLYYLYLSADDDGERFLGLASWVNSAYAEIPEATVTLGNAARVGLRVTIDHAALQFSYSLDERNFRPIGPVLDASILSDEKYPFDFTGAFLGLCCQDKTGARIAADFDFFEYREETA